MLCDTGVSGPRVCRRFEAIAVIESFCVSGLTGFEPCEDLDAAQERLAPGLEVSDWD